MRARAPASAANLGPGFDTLAIALDRFVEVEVEPSPRPVVRSEGEGAESSGDPSRLAARVAIDVAGTDQLAITVRSQIPMARGLGSSAALAVAAAAAAGADDPLAVAARMDGHAADAAASMVGGLVAAARVKGGVRAVRLALDVSLAFVVIVPELHLSTSLFRQALPNEVTRESGAFNLSRMALLIAGLADSRVLIAEATEDRLHQDSELVLSGRTPTAHRHDRRRCPGRVLVGGRPLAGRHLSGIGRPRCAERGVGRPQGHRRRGRGADSASGHAPADRDGDGGAGVYDFNAAD